MMNQIDVPYGVTVADLEAANTFANAELSQIVLQQESNTATGLPLTDKERAQRKEQEPQRNGVSVGKTKARITLWPNTTSCRR